MRMSSGLFLSLVLGACSAPGDDESATSVLEAELAGAGSCVLVADLSGSEEVPARVTDAQGKAVVGISADRTQIEFRLVVSRIENVTAAHIHPGAPGVNGPVAIPLAGSFAPGGGPSNGLLASGTAAIPADLAGLAETMIAGGTYVNVHTNDGVDPVNTGAGDFPGGEIRGQLLVAGGDCD
jgi:hypothetical protein